MNTGPAQSRPGITMPTTQRRDQQKEIAQEQRDALNILIGERVIYALGAAANLHRVQVRHLWSDHYRVNVYLGVDATSAKVAHSYFLDVDSDGNIHASTPKITKRY